MDGWGIGDGSKSDAIAAANTPVVDALYRKYPHSKLLTSGENVGLPGGQMGNSEVGHLNIGAGRIVYQDLALINKAVREDLISSNKEFLKAIDYAKTRKVTLHLIGLVSEGGVHSSSAHLIKLVEIASKKGVEKIAIHAFTDGRDTDPRSGYGYLQDLENKIKGTNAIIAGICGRYYAMDRDKRWERIKLAYDAMVHGKGEKTVDIKKSVLKSYEDELTDEFIKPVIHSDEKGFPLSLVKNGDAVLCFNFRTDRCREITMALTQQAFPEYRIDPLDLYYVTMTNYDPTFKNVHVMYDKDNLVNTLGEVLSNHNKSQIRIAETEKYPHVTFFFSGGREEPFPGEKRIMISSPKVATYDLQPEMSAFGVTDAIIKEVQEKSADFICLNFANPDMVGHTGIYQAVIKAVETIDLCMGKIIEEGIKSGYSFIIIADHGNADYMINQDGSPNTAHTTNPVPCILIDKDNHKIKDGKLCDLAPTILNLMNIPVPMEMTGEILID